MKKYQKIHIEIGNVCNLQCTFCPPVERQKKLMNFATFRNLIHQIKPLTETVCFHLMGEPLAHPQFQDFVDECLKFELPIFLVTNGTLLREDKVSALMLPIFKQINFSIHSFADNYPGADPRPYLNKIFQFVSEKQNKHPETYFNFRLWNLQSGHQNLSLNQQMLELILEQVKNWLFQEEKQKNQNQLVEKEQWHDDSDQSDFDQKISVNIQTQINLIREKISKVDLRRQKSVRLFKKIYLHFDSEFVWPSLDLPLLGTSGTCYGLSSHFGILADGTVVPCCLDKEGKIPLGNIHEKSVLEILADPMAISILDGFNKNKLVNELCQRCQYIERFTSSN